jgi:hypothetical protein
MGDVNMPHSILNFNGSTVMKYPYVSANGLECEESVIKMVLQSRGFKAAEKELLLRRGKRENWLFPIQVADYIAGYGIKCVLSGYKTHITHENIYDYIEKHYAEHAGKIMSHFNYQDVCTTMKKQNIYLDLPEVSVSINDIRKCEAAIALISYDDYLERENQFWGHYILITSCDNYNIYFHDPGPENAAPDRSMPIDLFMRIWKRFSFLDDGIILIYS